MLNKRKLDGRNLHRWIALMALAIGLSGCAKTSIGTAAPPYRGYLPKPDRIFVYDFAFSPDQVSPDSAIGARLVELAKHEPLSEQQRALGRAVADELAEQIVSGLKALSLPAERAPSQSPADGAAQSILEIEGQFVKVEQGNRLRRVVIGLGVGRSIVDTQVQIYDSSAAGRVLALDFTTLSRSSLKPGAAEALIGGPVVAGASAAAGAALEFNETARADARRTARLIVHYLAAQAYQRGWITRDAALKAHVNLQNTD